ncbi:8-oxo-dGTP diphosphatase [Pseudoxanthomonas indica]|uniref:8-oxo-dGTP diphosphatase n=1 Tax=Pseudoxanthomonas indica TaxID=428993 RepID=A0A1T5KBG8_9GAMM|nr:8-oxo-dGTP diphosphatase [Pseudoxanthomonas indica]
MRDLHVVAAVIQFSNKILAAKRLPGGPSGLKWEFPGGKVEKGESPQDALQREIREELSLEISVQQDIGTFATVIGDVRIHLQCFRCVAQSEVVVLSAHSEVMWCSPADLRTLDWALPDVPVIDVI